MNKMVEQKMNEMTDVFNSLPNCRVETSEDGKVLILSDTPVPWSDTIEKRDAHSEYKIGSITPHKAALSLYIDFSHELLDVDRVEDIVDSHSTLPYFEVVTKATNVKSW